jgi:hypothetical protein
MDVIINSAVQSPLVRTLETVATKAGSFTHHVPDNIPPVSFHKIVVNPVSGTGGFQKTMDFNIPRYGYLHKVVVRYTAKVKAYQALTVSGHGAYAMTDRVDLKTRNRPVQSMFGRSMYLEALWGGRGEGERKLIMSEWSDQSTGGLMSGATAGNDAEMVSYVELPLASTISPAHNYNCRFVEPLVVTVRTNSESAVSISQDLHVSRVDGADTSVVVDLLCYYLNYHDVTEQDIRNANYRPEAPAVVFANDTVEEAAIADSGASGTVNTVALKSNHYAYAISVIASDHDVPPVHAQSDGTNSLSNINSIYWLQFKGSGQILYESNSIENCLVDRFDYSLSTWSNSAEQGGAGQLSHPAGIGITSTGSQLTGRVKFGLSSNKAYNSGGIGLQTVSNPTLSLKIFGANKRISTFVHHYALVQIDSGTGAITRSIDA